MSHKTYLILSVLLIVSFALTACGAPAATQAPATQAPATEAPAATESPATQAPATEAPAQKVTIEWWHITTIDPGKTLWQARIGNPGDPPAGGKSLMIYLDNGAGGSLTLDGTRGGASVLDVFLKDSQQKVRDVWPDQTVREFTYVYSACGCPVKVLVKREGARTARVKDTPVMFPDDPAAVETISQLMKW